jgi:type II secretory ATPase GspE/PulE/Tfp pilus assembly ATPase PilB-like protein
LIQAGMSSDELTRVAIESGMTPISENGLKQARLKTTSIAEVYRACM